MTDFPEEAVEFGRCWSSAAGELAATKEAIAEAERRSGAAFVRRQDEVANALRDMARELQSRADKLSAKVERFKIEDQRRQHEIRRMVR